jgi:hypothetical protein
VVAWCGPEPVALSLLTDHPDRLRPVATDSLVLARGTTILHWRGMAMVSARHPAAPDPGRAAAARSQATALRGHIELSVPTQIWCTCTATEFVHGRTPDPSPWWSGSSPP